MMVHNENAIFFCISDNYSFAVANMILGLKKYSPSLKDRVDIIIYHDGISSQNIELLSVLHNNILFYTIEFPAEFYDMLNHRLVKKWGVYVLAKLKGFELVRRYKRSLFLDADMLIRGDVSKIFDIEEEIAWRKVIAWNPNEIFKDVIGTNDYISACNAGLIYFTDKLNKYQITNENILEAFSVIKDLKRGGIDERILAYIVYKNKIKLRELDISYNCPVPDSKKLDDVKIIHFLDYKGIITKPWKNLVAYLYFEDWAINYKKWIDMGGQGLVDFNIEDKYNLFGFDKAAKILNLNRINLQQQSEIQNLNKINLQYEMKIRVLQKKYNGIKNSTIWRLTEPLRNFLDRIKKIRRL